MYLPFDCKLMCCKVGSHAVASIALAFRLPFHCSFRRYEVGERFESKITGVERRSVAL